MTDLIRHLQTLWQTGNERCGVILTSGEVVELPNRAERPHLAFRVAAEDLAPYLDQVCATWHTHPSSSGNLSVADYRMFQEQDPWRHYIIAQTSVWEYRVDVDCLVLLHAIYSKESSHE